MDSDVLRPLVDTRVMIQKTRIAYGNRLEAIKEGRDITDEETTKLIEKWYDTFKQLESLATVDIVDVAEYLPIIDKMIKIKGVSFQLAARVASRIDIVRADTVSALWRYAGYAVIDGHREYNVSGEKSHFNSKLKSSVYLVTQSLLKCGDRSPYTPIYYSAKEHYQEKYGTGKDKWTKIHIHRAALRKMGKMWLSHLWTTWRKLENLPVRNLYVEEYMGHTSITTPEEFGW